MIKSVLLAALAASTLAVLSATAPAAADTSGLDVAVPTVHLPRHHAAAREVVATITVNREVRWSATVATRSYGGSDWVGHVFDVPHGPELLKPGANRIVLGTTDVISDPGPQQVTVVTTDPASGAEIGRATAVFGVIGRLARPRIRRVRVTGHRVVLRGRVTSDVPDLRLIVRGRHLGAAAARRLADVRWHPIDGRWAARLRISRPTRLRVRATSAYGKPVSSQWVTVRLSQRSRA